MDILTKHSYFESICADPGSIPYDLGIDPGLIRDWWISAEPAPEKKKLISIPFILSLFNTSLLLAL
jgi:hypothetical protein